MEYRGHVWQTGQGVVRPFGSLWIETVEAAQFRSHPDVSGAVAAKVPDAVVRGQG